MIYIDPYVITYYIYDKYKAYFEEAEQGNLSHLAKIGEEVSAARRLLDVRIQCRDEDLVEASEKVEEAVKEITEELKSADHENDANYLISLRISITKNGIEWKDIFGNQGSKVFELPPSFYPALVMTTAIYSYALSKKKEKVLLLLDEPDAFTYPSFAYTLGRVIKHLTVTSDYLSVITVTHSWDFYKGLSHGGESETFILDRSGKRIDVKPMEESWYVPGFSVSAVLN